MNIVFYYRIEDPALKAAQQADKAHGERMDAEGKAFASRFGMMPLFTNEPIPRFAGVGFPGGKKHAMHRMWTEPKRGDPRVYIKSKNVPPALRMVAQKMLDEWNEHYPHELTKPRESQLLAALKVNANKLQGQGMQYFHLDDVSWVMTTLKLDFPEVTASEFIAAKHEVEQRELAVQFRAQQAKQEGMLPMEELPAAEPTNEGEEV